MKQTFDSLAEAQKEADKKNDHGITQFCPLIKGVCKSGFPCGYVGPGCSLDGDQCACVCWEKAKAVDNKREYSTNSKSVETIVKSFGTDNVKGVPVLSINWIVSDPFCGNAMFTETEIYVNN